MSIEHLAAQARRLVEAGDLATAQALLHEALAGVNPDPTFANADLAAAAAIYARVLAVCGEPEPARRWAGYAHTASLRLFGAQDDRTLQAASVLAAALHRIGAHARSAHLYRELVDQLTARDGAHSPRVLAARADLATVLHARGECVDARTLLTKAWSAYRDQFGDGHPVGIKMLARLGSLERACGLTEAAQARFALAQALCRQHLPPGHRLGRQIAELARAPAGRRHVCADQGSGIDEALDGAAGGIEHQSRAPGSEPWLPPLSPAHQPRHRASHPVPPAPQGPSGGPAPTGTPARSAGHPADAHGVQPTGPPPEYQTAPGAGYQAAPVPPAAVGLGPAGQQPESATTGPAAPRGTGRLPYQPSLPTAPGDWDRAGWSQRADPEHAGWNPPANPDHAGWNPAANPDHAGRNPPANPADTGRNPPTDLDRGTGWADQAGWDGWGDWETDPAPAGRPRREQGGALAVPRPREVELARRVRSSTAMVAVPRRPDPRLARRRQRLRYALYTVLAIAIVLVIAIATVALIVRSGSGSAGHGTGAGPAGTDGAPLDGGQPGLDPATDATGTAVGGPGSAGGSTGGPATPAPTGLRLRDAGSSITLTWTYPAGVDGQVVLSGGRAGQPRHAFLTLPAGSTRQTVSGVDGPMNFCFTVAVSYSATVMAASAPVCTDRE